MFQDVVLGSVGFKSRCTKKTSHAMCSTDAIATSESSTEPLFGFVDGATQTEPKATASTTSSKGKDAKGDADAEEETLRTLEFIRRVGPTMLREMSKNATTSSYFGGNAVLVRMSRAHDHIRFSPGSCLLVRSQGSRNTSRSRLRRTSRSSSCSSSTSTRTSRRRRPKVGLPNLSLLELEALGYQLLIVFVVLIATNSKDKSKKLEPLPAAASLKLSCTGVSWNATGSSIAVAYGRFDHTGWCNYRSALCLWSVFQSDFNPLKPNLVLETSVRGSRFYPSVSEAKLTNCVTS